MSELADLALVIDECRARIASHDLSTPIRIGADLWLRIKHAYLQTTPQSTADLIGSHTIKIKTPSGKKLFVSAQELPQIWGTIPYARAVLEYEKVVDRLAMSYFGFANRGSGEAEPIFKKLPGADWESELPVSVVEGIREFLLIEFEDENDRERFRKFLGSKGKQGWSGISKELSRADWLTSAIPFVGEWLAVGAAERGELVLALAADPAIEGGLEEAIREAGREEKQQVAINRLGNEPSRITGGENILFYGAPGTGKSHDVWQMVGQSLSFATVFHPDMQNSDFAGALKPGVDANGSVTYAFRPGPFAAALAEAWKRPTEKVYLVIEELNRAAAAAVFGELFQLLDRRPDGAGRYEVNFPSTEFGDWFAAETGMTMKRLALPSNLSILATMNSADQGVYPLDTAFRRRWRQKYLPIDYSKAPDATLQYGTPSGVASIGWSQFVKALNNFLVSSLEVGEDRLVGPRFLDEHDLGEGTVPGKLLIYLWDDLLRHHGRADLFDGGIKTYGELDRRSTSGERIFSDKFLATIGDGASEAGVASGEARA